MLQLLASGALLIDEVDWVLHPLKSELMWTLGEKLPIDLAGDDGLRWIMG